MEKPVATYENQSFRTPEEELIYLRGEVSRRERQLVEKGKEANRDTLIRDELSSYKKVAPEKALHPELVVPQSEQKKIVLELTPEEHDEQIGRLLDILTSKGISNALSILEKMNDPHIDDDFERFLIQYIKAGFPVPGLKEKDPLYKALHNTLYEIALPDISKEEAAKTFKELISPMEQFYSGMFSVGNEGEHNRFFALEIAVANHSDEFVFYASVPDQKKNLFEKHLLSVFPKARITEKKDDYNIFSEKGNSVGSFARLERNAIFPIRLSDTFDYDPLNAILNSFSKIDRDGEGAAIQILFHPVGGEYTTRYKKSLDKIMKGASLSEATVGSSIADHLFSFAKAVIDVTGPDIKKDKKKKEGGSTESEKKEPKLPEAAIEAIKQKIASPIVLATIRIIASAPDIEGAESILSDVESAFNQFENTNGNAFVFDRPKGGKQKKLFHEFSYRLFNDAQGMPLNLKELSTVMHFPATGIKSAPQLKQSKAGTAPPPPEMPAEGTLLGINRDRNKETRIFMAREDRLRHFYTIGQTGTGKTTLLKNMIAQDILAGDGVCMIDPHGTDIQDILSIIPPERYNDVIYFDPSHTERPMALNMLEYDTRYPEQKTFVVNEMLSIFNKLFDMKVAGGPMFEQYFRNAVLLTLEDPETGNTLLDVSRVLSNKAYRDLKLSHCKNPIVVQFWNEIAAKAGGEASLQNIVPYITSKFDTFLSNDVMRPIISQEKSSFNFREVMDNRKILLINLSKGRLGDINSHLIGLIVVGKILMAALSRVDGLSESTPPFFLYIDEFQNVTTDSIAAILSEARKYKLSLNIAHQFIAQLDEKIRDAVFGNVGSIAGFRVGAEDAEYLEKQFAPVFTASDIMNLDNRNAYLKLLVHGRPIKAFNIETLPPPKGDLDKVAKLKELSYLSFGRERTLVEGEIMKKYEK